MALYNQLAVYNTCRHLLTEVVRASHNANREYRYTLFQDLRHTLTQLLIQIYRINRTHDKAHPLRVAREMVVEAGIYLQLLIDMKGISAKQYAMLIDLLDSAGRQMAAWEKAAVPPDNET